MMILMTEINHAHLWIMLPKEWFSEYVFYGMATRQGKYLVWSLHGWFDIIDQQVDSKILLLAYRRIDLKYIEPSVFICLYVL